MGGLCPWGHSTALWANTWARTHGSWVRRGGTTQAPVGKQWDTAQAHIGQAPQVLFAELNGLPPLTCWLHVAVGLAQVLLQAMFPPINVHHVKLSTCQRVVLLALDKATGGWLRWDRGAIMASGLAGAEQRVCKKTSIVV